jgi:hypothetical protein
MLAGHLGMIVTPRQGNRIPAHVAWVADNGCGPTKHGKVGAAYPGNAGYLAYLARLAPRRDACLFAAAPDVLGDAAATLARSAVMFGPIRAAGYLVALVAQDGLEREVIPWHDFDVLFIGGSTEWKMGEAAAQLVAEAKWHGKQVHFGRVNSYRRLSYAAGLGCDTADGTYLVFGPDKNLPTLLHWVELVNATTVPDLVLVIRLGGRAGWSLAA